MEWNGRHERVHGAGGICISVMRDVQQSREKTKQKKGKPKRTEKRKIVQPKNEVRCGGYYSQVEAGGGRNPGSWYMVSR